MVVKVYISGISGNKEVKKRQQRVMMILDSKNVKYDVIDITEPGRETDKDFMQNNSKSNGGTVSDPNPRSPLPPQIFNDEEYCGDYDHFDMANEVDTLEQFLKVEAPPEEPVQAENDTEKTINGDSDGSTAVKVADVEPENKTATTENRDSSAVKEHDTSTSKEGTPAKDIDETGDATKELKEKSPEKDTTERQKSVEKEGTADAKDEATEKEIEATSTDVLEGSPEKEVLDKNGSVSSREQSREKSVPTNKGKDEPSDALIQSEQAAAAE